MDTKIQWQSYEWLTRERWGSYNPQRPEVWYSPNMVQFKDDILLLGVNYKPTLINTELGLSNIQSQPDLKIVPYQVGLVSCTEQFGYGRFEIEAKLPYKQPYAWPAFWMWSWDSWPPEIDVFEAYSDDEGSYVNHSLGVLLGRFWRVASNLHLSQRGIPSNYDIGAKYHFFGFKDPSEHFINYAVEWTPDRVEFFYDGRSVRKVTNKKKLAQLEGKKMNVILNNSVQKDILDIGPVMDKWFEIKSFKYTKL